MPSSEVTCPWCRFTWSRPLYASANVANNPGLKARVISGELFSVACPSCGIATETRQGCLYRDAEKQLIIRLQADREETGQAAALELGDASCDACTLRIVHSAHDLREKVLIFDAGLNDGIVELCKALLSGRDPELRDTILRFEFVDAAGQLVFAVIRPGRQQRNVSVPRGYYDAVRTRGFSDLAARAEERGTWIAIDSDAVSLYATKKAS